MKKTVISLAAAVLFALVAAIPLFGQWFFDFENGLALPGYNDVRVPGDTGTPFSLIDDLTSDPSYFFRVRLGYQWRSGHNISLFAAPLSLHAAGSVDEEIFFNACSHTELMQVAYSDFERLVKPKVASFGVVR